MIKYTEEIKLEAMEKLTMSSEKRREDESFEEYRLRLKEMAKELKVRLKGKMFHNVGTYRKRRIIKKASHNQPGGL